MSDSKGKFIFYVFMFISSVVLMKYMNKWMGIDDENILLILYGIINILYWIYKAFATVIVRFFSYDNHKEYYAGKFDLSQKPRTSSYSKFKHKKVNENERLINELSETMELSNNITIYEIKK